MDIRDMRLVIAAHHEPGATKIARDIRERGVEEVFNAIPATLKVDIRDCYNSIKQCGGELLTPEDPQWPSLLDD